MRAFRLTAPHKIELTAALQPEPGPGEVLIKIGAAGLCHSDLHIMDAPIEAGFPVPLTLGHENAGWVEVLGPGVSGWSKGEPVAVYGIIGCGYCRACLRGCDNECQVKAAGGIGISQDGGMAEYVRVPVRQIFRIGDLDLSQAAPLTDAGLTPYHAIQICRDRLQPASTCLVIGVGGLGHLALQILAATTAIRIIAVDVKDEALKLAKEVGAQYALKSDAHTAAAIRDLVGPAPCGADVVLDFVGSTPSLALGAAVIATGGWLAMVGLASGALQLSPNAVGKMGVPFGARVIIPYWGTRPELAEVIALAQAGRITAHVEKFSLDQAPLAYEKLRTGNLQGRGVLLP